MSSKRTPGIPRRIDPLLIDIIEDYQRKNNLPSFPRATHEFGLDIQRLLSPGRRKRRYDLFDGIL